MLKYKPGFTKPNTIMLSLTLNLICLQMNKRSVVSILSSVTSREHGAVDVHVALAGAVAAELPGLGAVVQRDKPVAVAQAEVAGLEPEHALAVSVPGGEEVTF